MEDMLPQAQTTFDRILAGYDGLPGFKKTKPATVITAIPIVGVVTSYIVQTMRTDAGFTIFVQIMDAEGRARFVLTDKVAAALYRQRQSLTDRSTPQSRAKQARKAQREKARRKKQARRQAWAVKNGTH